METYPIYTILHMGLVAEEKVFHYTWKIRQNLYTQRSQWTKRSRLGGLLFVKVASQTAQLEEKGLKVTVSRDFLLLVFSWISFPPAPEYPIRTVSNFFEISWRYLQVKVQHRYQRHWWQNCRRYYWHRWQIWPPVSLVLLIPVANNYNNIRLLRPWSELEGKNVSIS